MRFARVVFFIAGVWGILILTPLYFMFDVIGRQYPPPITHTDFYYGFLSVALVWQVAFFVIGSDPGRFRPMMIVAALEKFGYMATLGTLYAQSRMQGAIGNRIPLYGLSGLCFSIRPDMCPPAEPCCQVPAYWSP
jgi:hypothetical protein